MLNKINDFKLTSTIVKQIYDNINYLNNSTLSTLFTKNEHKIMNIF